MYSAWRRTDDKGLTEWFCYSCKKWEANPATLVTALVNDTGAQDNQVGYQHTPSCPDPLLTKEDFWEEFN